MEMPRFRGQSGAFGSILDKDIVMLCSGDREKRAPKHEEAGWTTPPRRCETRPAMDVLLPERIGEWQAAGR
jgi:hypothetical protein